MMYVFPFNLFLFIFSVIIINFILRYFINYTLIMILFFFLLLMLMLLSIYFK